jgi:regulator of cell morphogenesis and NO signaling
MKSEITDYIVSFYHDRLRSFLPELIFLADKVEKVHADHKNCPKGLTSKLKDIQNELLGHMMKEEQILFPLIKNGRGSHAHMPIKVMQEEHTHHANSLAVLRDIAFNFDLTEGACRTWNTLYKGLDQLELELMEHINLENSILFMRALHDH